jgi:hypothetical protein
LRAQFRKRGGKLNKTDRHGLQRNFLQIALSVICLLPRSTSVVSAQSVARRINSIVWLSNRVHTKQSLYRIRRSMHRYFRL